jgi:7,8-dihydropterin-6-yl-methyl-4-(beta-D-ribofuranosyl)aminobenzene 5'-phosphate synthase
MTNAGSSTGEMGRREVLCRGGTALVGALVASVTGGAKVARAQGLAGRVPEVDRLAVRVVVDNYHFALTRSFKKGPVEIQRYVLPLSDRPPRKAPVSEFGLSLHLETQRGGESRRILIDFGYTPEALLNNMELFGIDPAALDALVLSHGHFDHFGGMVGFLQQARGKLKPGLPFFVGGEEAFCSREFIGGPRPLNFGALDRKAISEAGVRLVFAGDPALVADHAFTTGHVPRATFERVLSPTQMKIGVVDGLGCFPDEFPAEERQKGVMPDEFRHELATCVNIRGRGLVVMTSCGHRGVVNSVKRAQAVSGIRKVHAVLGGFHLAPHPEDYVRATIAALQEIDPDYVIPMHCTGEPFYEIMQRELPQKLIRSYTGTRFVFSA